jgi:hypothetical protein
VSNFSTLNWNRASLEKLKSKGSSYIISLIEDIQKSYPPSDEREVRIQILQKALKELKST